MHARAGIVLLAVALLALALLPPLAKALGQPYYIDLVRRIMIFSIAALSLNLILGYGGLVSFGHAAYLGIGGYAVGILAFYGHTGGALQWTVATGASALVALAIGAISIRTSGIFFIMITLAFTQMLYYLGVSIEEFGGDDGMRLATKSDFGALLDLSDPTVFYYLVLALLVAVMGLLKRIVESRFGQVLRAAKSNEARTQAIGLAPYPYRQAAFVIAGAICGLAGALFANDTGYLTPNYMHWTRSGEIMFMVILGGMGTLSGPVLGTFALLLMEEMLKGMTGWVGDYWQLWLGVFLVLVVLLTRRGLASLLPGARREEEGG